MERIMSGQDENRGVTREGAKGVVREVAHNLLHLAILLVSAGTAWWVNAWVYAGLGLAYVAINTATIYKVNPEVINKRAKLIQDDTKSFDRVFVGVYMVLVIATSVIAGLDAVRFGWSNVHIVIIVLGLNLYLMACALVTWAMAVNAHFETTVFIRDGQKVCNTGPYRIVRHPGYVAAIMGGYGYTLILGSWAGLIPATGLAILFIWRTAREDATLLKELPGYGEFAKTTRYRLMPLVW